MRYLLIFSFFAVFFSCDGNPLYKTETKVKLELKPGAPFEPVRLPDYVPNAVVDSFWIGKKYAYAKVYLYSGVNSRDSIIQENRLHKTVINRKGFSLSQKEIEKINFHVLNGKVATDSSASADCFQPHHGIVFYDSADFPAGHISVCFLCNDMKVFPSGNKFTLDTLEKLFLDRGIPVLDEEEIQGYRKYKN